MRRYRRKNNYKKYNKYKRYNSYRKRNNNYKRSFYKERDRSKQFNPWIIVILIILVALWNIRYFLLAIITVALSLYVFYKGWKYFANKKFTPEIIGFLGEEKFSQQILKKPLQRKLGLNEVDSLVWKSQQDKYAPYDFVLNKYYYFEIKTTVKTKPYFILTDNELKHLRANIDRYVLICYYDWNAPFVRRKIYIGKNLKKLKFQMFKNTDKWFYQGN